MRRPLVFFVTMMFSGGSALAASGDVWTVAGDNVNLRRGPGTAHEIKRQLSRDQTVIERGGGAEWRQVEVVGTDGLLGWVHRSLLVGNPAAAVNVPARASEPITSSDDVVDLEAVTTVRVREAFQDKAPPDVPDEENPLSAPADRLADPEAVLEQMRGYVKRRDKLPKDPATPRVGHSGREIISPVPIRNPGDQSRVPTELVLASSPSAEGIDLDAMEQFRDSVSYLNNRAWSVAGIKLFSEIEPIGGGVVQVKTTDDWFEVPKIGQTSYLNTLVDRWSSAKADGAPAGVMLVDPKGELLMHQSKP
ncbi:MAG: SH3 domain-containing protein [Geminicoccaceae bacterium]